MDFFNKYVSNYDMSDPDISYKYHHSYRVMDNMEILSICMNLPYKDIELAKCIGLLHDIGRFEQDKLYDSFIDDKMDHGTYGEELLRKENILLNFDIDKDDYEVVYKAIRNHNKYKIEDGLTERELLFAKLIRDADKLDILYALSEEKIDRLLQDDKKISNPIKDDFFNNKIADEKELKSLNDGIVKFLCYTYDINFKYTLDIINKYKYYDKIYERLIHKDIFKPYFEYINNYIKERTD